MKKECVYTGCTRMLDRRGQGPHNRMHERNGDKLKSVNGKSETVISILAKATENALTVEPIQPMKALEYVRAMQKLAV